MGPVSVTYLALPFPKGQWVPKDHECDVGLQHAEENLTPLFGQ